jgi:hypothetical protein
MVVGMTLLQTDATHRIQERIRASVPEEKFADL